MSLKGAPPTDERAQRSRGVVTLCVSDFRLGSGGSCGATRRTPAEEKHWLGTSETGGVPHRQHGRVTRSDTSLPCSPLLPP